MTRKPHGEGTRFDQGDHYHCVDLLSGRGRRSRQHPVADRHGCLRGRNAGADRQKPRRQPRGQAGSPVSRALRARFRSAVANTERADPPGLCVVLACRRRGCKSGCRPAKGRAAAGNGACRIHIRQRAGGCRGACAGQAEGGRCGRQAGPAEILRTAVGCADRRDQGAAEADLGPGILLAWHRERTTRHRAQDPHRAPA